MDDDRSVGAVDDPDFEQVAGSVCADEHRQIVIEVVDEDRMVEGVDHVSSRMPCLRALVATSGASTPTSYLAGDATAS